MSATVICPICGAEVPKVHKFCGACGRPIAQQQEAVLQTACLDTASMMPRAHLILVRGGGADGTSYPLPDQEQSIGRTSGAYTFPDDPYLSPLHATFYYQSGRLYVRDENSVNGVYLRIHGSADLCDGDCLLAGEEIMVVGLSDITGQMIAQDQTHFFASPRPNKSLRIVQLIDGGHRGLSHMVTGDKVTIGRANCDLSFPDDRFISGRHCQIEFNGSSARVVDSNSRNGTYLRIHGPHALMDGDHLFLGKQLLRVELPA